MVGYERVEVEHNPAWFCCRLKANNKYKFRVLAQNKIGKGEPSNPTIGQCDISVDEPKLNPVGVRTLDEGQDKLVITWQVRRPVLSIVW